MKSFQNAITYISFINFCQSAAYWAVNFCTSRFAQFLTVLKQRHNVYMLKFQTFICMFCSWRMHRHETWVLKVFISCNKLLYTYTNKFINLINPIYQNWVHLTGFLIIKKVYIKFSHLEINFFLLYIYFFLNKGLNSKLKFFFRAYDINTNFFV